MRYLLGNWLADSTKSTRNSQWKHYLQFCDDYERVPLPASLDTILLYLSHMSLSFKYVSIINYLSSVWTLHKLNGFLHIDKGTFELHVTLRGIRRTLL